MTPLLLASTLLFADRLDGDVRLDRQPPVLKTGTAFQQELGRPLTAAWKNVPLRTVLRRIGESRKISILLDRGIDPTQRIAVEFNNQLLQSALETIAIKSGGQVSILANTVCIAPRASAAKLRTFVAIRFNELQSPDINLPKGRLVELGNRRTLHWNDLDRPADILNALAKRYDLQIEGLDRVPHDLWASATIPAVNAVEAFSLVLNQFDLTFQWSEAAGGLEIVPSPGEIAISRTYAPRGLTAATAAKEWAEKIDGIEAKVSGRRVLVTGTVEQHEVIAKLLQPSSDDTAKPKSPSSTTPLAKRSYAKLKFSRVPAIALIRRLEKTGIVFDYDEDQLNAAGIDFKTPISMDLKDASADEVFAAFCEQLGLRYTTDNLTVRFSPK